MIVTSRLRLFGKSFVKSALGTRPRQMTMLRSLSSSSRSVCRQRIPSSLSRSLRLRNLSTQSTSVSSKAGATTLLLGLGSGAIVASYFLWPDSSRAAPTKQDALLSPTHFTPVEVTATEPCPDPNTRLMTLTVPRQAIPALDQTAFQPIWSIYIKDDDIQVERAFTPLEGIDNEGRMKFWIKRYERGEVGRWLHAKKPGDKIEIRGPLKTWSWQDGEWDEVIMVRTLHNSCCVVVIIASRYQVAPVSRLSTS